MTETTSSPVLATHQETIKRDDGHRQVASEQDERSRRSNSRYNESGDSRQGRTERSEPEELRNNTQSYRQQSQSQQPRVEPRIQASVYRNALTNSSNNRAPQPRTAPSQRPPQSGPQDPPPRSIHRPPSGGVQADRLKQNAKALRQKVHDTTSRLRQTEKQNDELAVLLESAKLQLSEARQDLDASRAFRGTESSGDESLIIALQDLNKGIDDMASAFVQQMPEGVPLEHNALSAFCQNAKGLALFAEQALHARLSARDFMGRTVAFRFQSMLRRYIFSPFIPGLNMNDEAVNHSFKDLYSSVQKGEPQERSARWRAISYLNGYPERDDGRLIEFATRDFESGINGAVPHIFSRNIPKTISVTDLRKHARKLIADAIKWRDRAMSSHLSFDFEPFTASAGEAFTPAHMEPEGPATRVGVREGSKVIVAAGFGLIAWKNVANEGGGFKREGRISLKAPVVCWDQSRTHSSRMWPWK